MHSTCPKNAAFKTRQYVKWYGQPTGKYYAVYFAGHTVAVEKDGNAVVGAGKNILFWDVDESGNVIAVKYSDGRKAASGNASDPSLSHMRTNISGKDLEFDPTTLGMNDEGTNFYNRSIVFNANGHKVQVEINGVKSTEYVCTRCMRTSKKAD